MTAQRAKCLTEFDELFDEFAQLLKNPEVGGELAAAGVNISLAIVAVDGLRAYLHGNKESAAEDLGLVTEEIRARLATARQSAKGSPL